MISVSLTPRVDNIEISILWKNAALSKFADMNNKAFGDKAYIKWNFTKFLIDREGKVVARFEPTVDMEEVRAAVAAELRN